MRCTETATHGCAGPDGAGVIRFEVWPHRSLDRYGTAAVVGIAAVGAAAVVLRSPAAAFWPLAIAAMLTVGALALAFWSNNRAARLVETIEIGPEVVRVRRVSEREPERTIELATYWVRVVLGQERRLANRLVLTERGRMCSIGECLSPDERKVLAAAIAAGLERMRRGN
ncbi:MAG: DUF2244 domain-containing protein [Hyphomicrobiaceae bacterium]|nr:DUF2244 domain-containing protein [Hyphomicrobiaceae bacterium]